MAAPVNITANQQANNVGSTFGPFNVVVSTAGSAIVVYIAAWRFTTTGNLSAAPTAAGLTFELVSDGTTSARIGKQSDSGGGAGRAEHAWYIARNVSAGTHAITWNFVNSSGNFACGFACEVPAVPATGAYCDIVRNHSQAFAAGLTSVSVASGGSLPNAKASALVAASSLGTNVWNGGTSADNTAPAGWTRMRAYYTNFPVDGKPYQASYLDAASVAPLSATWTITDGSLAEGALATMVVLRDAAGTNYVEILLDPDTEDGVVINGTTGWKVDITPNDPADGYTVYSGVSAQATGNEIRVVGAGAGVAIGGLVNVKVSNAALNYTSGDGVGTVRAAP